MPDLEFKAVGKRPDGVMLYRLVIDGRTTGDHLTIDEVIARIDRRDEESLGERHVPGGCIR